MMQFSLLALLVVCFTDITIGVPLKMKRSTSEERESGLNFFDQFQSMFGWGGGAAPLPTTLRPTNPPTTYRPPHPRPPTTIRTPPAHQHAATTATYYGGHSQPHYGPPVPSRAQAMPGSPSTWPRIPSPTAPQQYQRQAPESSPGNLDLSSKPGQNWPPPQDGSQDSGQTTLPPLRHQKYPSPIPGIYQPSPGSQYPPPSSQYPPPSSQYPPQRPDQYPAPPQYSPYQYPAQPYYYPPYYQPSYFTQLSQGYNLPMISSPSPTTFTQQAEEVEPEDSHKIPNKHSAVPNKASLPGPSFFLPFPVTKSKLPISILPPEDCHTEDNLIGECLSASECGSTSGHPSGLCHMGRDVSLHARVCCIYPAHCGFGTNHRVTYLRSPNYPQTTPMVSACPFTLNLLPGVCQVRLDFLDFHMKPMTHGTCDPSNSLTIKSSHSSTLLPMTNLCGRVATGKDDPLRTDIPHLYAHFDIDPVPEKEDKKVPNKDTVPYLQLNFNVSNYPSSWNIRVSQIICDGANLQAPSGCSQYFNSNSGNITSINLPDRQYMADTSLDICIARDPSACAIKYSMKTMGVGPTKSGGLGYGLVCDDYIKFRGEKTSMCGKGEGRQLVLPVKGPMGLSFRSDSSHIPEADVGYRLEYEYLHNCTGQQFYKYPVTK